MQLSRSLGKVSGPKPVGRSRRTLIVRAEGVQDLLARDRKEPKLAKDLLDAGTASSSKDQVVRTRQERRARNERRERGEKVEQDAANRPKRCKEALDKGLELFKEKKYDEAIGMFNLALELPGNGAYRMPGSPREYSCPSDAEEQAALYNMACAYAQMGQRASCITCLEAVLDSGFTDYKTIRTDPDLAPARGPEMDAMLSKYDSPLAMLRKILPGNSEQKVLVSDTNKPWLLW